ncbi:hypothetical protein RH831_08910 [Halodesulfurarchaeum sp. HSR-GB]|uniref:hypothetical protein n=1 Tax=Halodesulfurarchaeum sp. HSR-GB TaxID=3074077 RepID=UPI0028665D81|nr:hypothetical protein [Halodesulfurarchaeum sp. HSR-GB]MDR5657299.1 hypothetical protein [Halodesulfurarchaeum sp. HSR-GB]
MIDEQLARGTDRRISVGESWETFAGYLQGFGVGMGLAALGFLVWPSHASPSAGVIAIVAIVFSYVIEKRLAGGAQ